MDNLEWLRHNKSLLKNILKTSRFAISKGEVTNCIYITCKDCDFNKDNLVNTDCSKQRKKWLESEHKSIYKKGDIILNKQGKLVFVVEDTGKDIVVVEDKNNLENENSIASYVIEYDDIERKVSNIYD